MDFTHTCNFAILAALMKRTSPLALHSFHAHMQFRDFGRLGETSFGRCVAWISRTSCRPGFFLPVRVLSRLFRGKFLAALLQAYAAGQLCWPERLAALAVPEAFGAWLKPLAAKE
jgi:hypothetical protein